MRLRLSDGRMSVGLAIKYINKFRKYCIHMKPLVYYSVGDFIHIHREVNKYKNYCEVLVNAKGEVAYAEPSHQDAVFNGDINAKLLYEYKVGVLDYSQEKLCDDFNVLMVWHEFSKFGKKLPTPEQLATIYKLYLNGCISSDCWTCFLSDIAEKSWSNRRNQ